MPRPPEPNPSLCPLCGQPNLCAMAAGQSPEHCWCMAHTIDRQALTAVPESARGTACICPACGTPRACSNPPVAE